MQLSYARVLCHYEILLYDKRRMARLDGEKLVLCSAHKRGLINPRWQQSNNGCNANILCN